MNRFEQEISNAINTLGLGPAQFLRCDSASSSEVAKRAKVRFVLGNPRVWWLGFQKPYNCEKYGDAKDWEQRLRATLPADAKRCWLIVESDTEVYPVYDVEIDQVVPVLRECNFFEYYLLDCEFEWILADTDHNQLILARPIDFGHAEAEG